MSKKKWVLTVLTVLALSIGSIEMGQAAPLRSSGQAVENPVITQATISIDQAKSIALQQVPGRIVHIDLDRDDGILKYEIIVINKQNEVYEVEINANTGKVIKVEKEMD